eukprot:scaffold91474_cov21-Tisochrysis_lutea.AAC.1
MGWLGAVGMHGLNCKQPFRCAAMCEFIPATIVGNSATTACDDLVLHHVHMSVLIMSILWCSITPTPLGKAWSCNLDPGAACFDLGLSARAWGCVLGLGAGPGAVCLGLSGTRAWKICFGIEKSLSSIIMCMSVCNTPGGSYHKWIVAVSGQELLMCQQEPVRSRSMRTTRSIPGGGD